MTGNTLKVSRGCSLVFSQQALRYCRKVKTQEVYAQHNERSNNLRRAKEFWFLKIPAYGIRDGIKVPVKRFSRER